MSYEFKEKIKEDLEYLLEGVSIDYYSSEELVHKQKVKELDNVYTQAEAFDSIVKAYDEASSEGQMVYEFSNIIEKYESGESD